MTDFTSRSYPDKTGQEGKTDTFRRGTSYVLPQLSVTVLADMMTKAKVNLDDNAVKGTYVSRKGERHVVVISSTHSSKTKHVIFQAAGEVVTEGELDNAIAANTSNEKLLDKNGDPIEDEVR